MVRVAPRVFSGCNAAHLFSFLCWAFCFVCFLFIVLRPHPRLFIVLCPHPRLFIVLCPHPRLFIVLCPHPRCFVGICVPHLFSFLCFVCSLVCFVLFFCPMLPVSLDCPTLVAPLVFSRKPWTINHRLSNHCTK